jgi:hypothetical protein
MMTMQGMYQGDNPIPRIVATIGMLLLWPAAKLSGQDYYGGDVMIVAIIVWTGIWGLVLLFRSRAQHESDRDAA